MKLTGKLIENTFVVGLCVGLIIRDGFGFGRFDHGIMIFGTLLGLLYLFGEYWVNRPAEKNARTVIVTILYGLSSWLILHSFYFRLLYLPGAEEIGLLGFTMLAISLIVDFITAINKTKVLTKRTIWRFSLFTLSIIILANTPEDNRIKVTYRNYPDFLQFYEREKGSRPFYLIYNEYFD